MEGNLMVKLEEGSKLCVYVCVVGGGGGGGTSAYLDKPDHWRRGPSSGVGWWAYLGKT